MSQLGISHRLVGCKMPHWGGWQHTYSLVPSHAARWKGAYVISSFPEFYAVRRQVEEAAERLRAATSTVDLKGQEARLADLEVQSSRNDLWDNPDKAQAVLSAITEIKQQIGEIQKFRSKVSDRLSIFCVCFIDGVQDMAAWQ
jgi:hypothetical protein